MLNLAVTALREPDPQLIWRPVATELLNACGGEFLFLKRDGPSGEGQSLSFWAAGGTAVRDLDAAVRERLGRATPLADHYGATGDRTPRTAADVLGERGWRDSGTAALLRDALGTDHLLVLPLPDGARPVGYFLICRSGTDFTADHLAYARRIQPLLAGVDRQAELLVRHATATPHARDRHTPTAPHPQTPEAPNGQPAPEDGAPGGDLTPRELTVLGLLGDALTAGVIARRLGISVHTVQKHIQSIYRKLGTRDRVATVLLAQTHGLIPAAATAPGSPPAKGRRRG
ncbi:response regulator transcription factor [Streptomyces sp. G45]|uniref:helix-turn-helix transcriptional regulator n=1 Tax=Streptomyces sp. G45 TaxID=3406627 RepID=UPI003C1813CC